MASLRALECLVTVTDAGSVTAAATRLHLSQPALSHHLSTLEAEVGTPLFERLPRGVRPTSAGRQMLQDARTAVEAASRAVSTGRAVAAGQRGHIRVGCAESLVAPLLAPALRAFRARRPDVEVTLEEATSADVLDAGIAAGRLDLTIGPRPTAPSGRVRVLGQEEIAVAMPHGHRLARRRQTPTMQEVGAQPLVHHHPDSGLRSYLDACAAERGAVLRPTLTSRHATAAAMLASAGLGLALVPVSALPDDFAGVARPLRPRLRREVVVVAGDRDALVDELVAVLRRRGVPALCATEMETDRGDHPSGAPRGPLPDRV